MTLYDIEMYRFYRPNCQFIFTVYTVTSSRLHVYVLDVFCGFQKAAFVLLFSLKGSCYSFMRKYRFHLVHLSVCPLQLVSATPPKLLDKFC